MSTPTMTFLAVCDEGTLSAAGQVLRIATSTVGRRIDELEAHLGVCLLRRTSRGIELTEAGRTYRAIASQGRDLLREAEERVRALSAEPSGILRIAVPNWMIRGTIDRIATAFLIEFPKVDLQIMGTDGDDALHEGFHVVIRASRTPPPEHLLQRVIGRLGMTICAAPSWLAANPPLLTPAELAETGCIVLGSDPTRAATIRLTQREQVWELLAQTRLFTTSLPMAKHAALNGLGPVGLPTLAIDRHLQQGTLVPVLTGWTLDPVNITVLTSNTRPHPVTIARFLDHLIRKVAQLESRFASVEHGP